MPSFVIDPWNNFVRVFELPKRMPTDFCFGGPVTTMFEMVDWFTPFVEISQANVEKEEWLKQGRTYPTLEITLDEIQDRMVDHLSRKMYLQAGRTYLLLFNCGASLTFKMGGTVQ